MSIFVKVAAITLITTCSVGAAADCKTEAQQLLEAIQSQALTGLNDAQQQQTQQVIEQFCNQRVAREEAEKPDTFTELMLSGEGGDKPGNKRLKKFGR